MRKIDENTMNNQNTIQTKSLFAFIFNLFLCQNNANAPNKMMTNTGIPSIKENFSLKTPRRVMVFSAVDQINLLIDTKSFAYPATVLFSSITVLPFSRIIGIQKNKDVITLDNPTTQSLILSKRNERVLV